MALLVKDIIKDNSEMYVSENYIKNPVFSIILPTYSRGESKSINRAMDSFLAQTFERFELIIVDDASVDGTFDICMDYLKTDNRIKIIRHKKNIGLPAISTYEAYKEAAGVYFCFGFDDNTWDKHALQRTYTFYKERNIKAGYGITRLKEPGKATFVEFGIPGPHGDSALFFGNYIGEGSVVLHRDVFEDIGLFDPHISLTRLCDWDLWQRLIQRYDFIPTGIQFATEYGVTMADSLGNTRELYRWLMAEYQQSRVECAVLKPDNYGNVDIVSYPENCTKYYEDKLEDSLKYYQKKFWFNKGILGKKNDTSSSDQKRRVLIVGNGGISASLMSFTEYKGDEFILWFCDYFGMDATWLLMVDIVVQIRLLPDDNWLAEICNDVKIPIYYYTDDNFREIFREQKDVPEYKNMNREYLSRYEGIIVSSYALADYYKENLLHDNLIYLPPILTQRVKKVVKSRKETISIGYMGGAFRHSVFLHSVLPAILKLAEEFEMQLVLPKDDELLRVFDKNQSLRVVWYGRDVNYTRVLQKIAAEGVDILVHPGEKGKNNRFKTKNCLANAVILDAALVTSDVEPYNMKDVFFGKYIVSENKVASWYEAIKSIITDLSATERMKKEASRCVREEYSTEKGWEALTKSMMSAYVEPDFARRAEVLLHFQMRSNAGGDVAFVQEERRPHPDHIASQILRKKRRYRFTPQRESFERAALAFARFGDSEGRIEIAIQSLKGEVLAVSTVDMCEVEKDEITVCQFDRRVESSGEDLLVEIEAVYEQSEGECGVFENKINKTFIYRCFNRIGMPLLGRNVIWIDTQ